MAIINRYKGFNENVTALNTKRDRDTSFGESVTRDLNSINTSNPAKISNSYSSNYVNKFGSSSNYSTNELQIIQSMVTENIQANGITVRYMPRNTGLYDEVWNESPESQFDKGLQMDMILDSAMGFEGEGDLMSQYGIEFREEVMLSLSITRFETLYGEYLLNNPNYKRTRPLEGDLIVIPFGISSLNNNQYFPKFFEITKVSTFGEEQFFQYGDNFRYKIRAKLFELSYEKIGYNPTISHADVYGVHTPEETKITKVENISNLTATNYVYDIAKDSESVVDNFGDNYEIEKASQVRQIDNLKDKAKVITKDYTAIAFGYTKGVISNLDDI